MNGFMSDSYKRRILWVVFWVICVCIVITGISENRSRKLNEVNAVALPVAVVQGPMYQSYCFERSCAPTCEYIEDNNMYIGESRVVEEGCEGTQRITVLRTFYNGEQVKEGVIENEIVEEPVARVIAVGTKAKPEYIIPVEDYVYTSDFGPRWGTTHEGIDLAVSEGTDVLASADGIVTRSEWYSGYGICVDIEHYNGTVTRYAHLCQSNVEVGDELFQGQVLGLSGNTGNSTGPHLHFEIRIDNEPVNPLEYVEVKR